VWYFRCCTIQGLGSLLSDLLRTKTKGSQM